MDEKSKLNDEIEELRKMLNIPKLYLSNYFSDIKSKIDLHYAKTFESDKETWVQLIEKVEVYENEFLRKFKLNDQLKAELSEEIEEIRTRINEANFKEIENMTEKLKRILLTDKTFLLMNLTNLHKKDEKDPNIRLALVYANKYLNEEKIEKLKEEDNSVITNESIKLKKLREFILQSDQMLIKLDFKIINSIDLSKNFKDSLTNKNIITSDLFKDFIGLEFLSLANNSINSIESNTFQGLKNLKYLFLNNNQLKEINDAIFTGLINLKSLNISKNKISTIKFENFKDLVNLQQLNLSNNNLVRASFEDDCFKNLNELKEIFLNNNQIESIDGKIFAGLNNLQWLDVSNNKLKSVADNSFTSLNKLETLILNENRQNELNHKKLFNKISDKIRTFFKSEEKFNLEAPEIPSSTQSSNDILNRNLLKNSCATFGLNFWLVLDFISDQRIYSLTNSDLTKELIKSIKNSEFRFSESAFQIEMEQNGAEKIFNSETQSLFSNFVTSYTKGSKLQLIDLSLEGIDSSFIKNTKPNIEIGEQYVARWDCGSIYSLKVFLINHDFEIKDKFEFDDKFDQWYRDGWKQVVHKFQYKESYDSLRYIIFYHSGKDTQYWAGNFGSKMTNSFVRFVS